MELYIGDNSAFEESAGQTLSEIGVTSGTLNLILRQWYLSVLDESQFSKCLETRKIIGLNSWERCWKMKIIASKRNIWLCLAETLQMEARSLILCNACCFPLKYSQLPKSYNYYINCRIYKSTRRWIISELEARENIRKRT